MSIAVYPGSFDPMTNGHLDIVERGLALFDEVVVVVSDNTRKSALFTATERLELCREALADHGLERVRVVRHEGLTVDCLKSLGSRVLLRGLRAMGDFEFEFNISLMNRRLWPEAETVYLPTREQYMGLNSTLVKEIARLGGDAAPFVPPSVARALRDRFPTGKG